MGNPHGTHVKQVDKNRMGPIWVKMWAGSGTHMKQVDRNGMGPRWAEMRARSGGNVGRIWDPYGQPTWDPYKTDGKNRVGPICVAHVFVLAGLVSKVLSVSPPIVCHSSGKK